MLKGFAYDLFAFALREPVTESDFEITQRNFAAVAIEDRHQRAESECEPVTTSA
jgi:hypothetical protein